MNFIKKLCLQLFAEGGDGGAGGAAPGVGGESATAPVTGEQRLRDLGVPEHVLEKRANRKSAKSASKAPAQTEAQQVASAEEPTEEQTTAPARMTWDEIMADPEYNKNMQDTVQKRLKSAKGAEESLSKLAPAIELLANKYGLDINNMDYDALTQAISDDDGFYEDEALARGKTIAETKNEVLQEQATAREQRTLEAQRMTNHFDRMEQQAQQLKQMFPNFDLRKELENPVFARMTAPSYMDAGFTLEDAYYAVHRKEIDAARNQVVAQETAKRMSNAIQSGQRRPVENGTTGRAASVTTFDYRTASKAEREALKRDIYSGKKIYPGQR
jgi:hypothetical protein